MRINKSVLSVSRLIHIYVSMALLTLMIFFSITGVTLNHPEWFAEDEAEVSEADFILSTTLLSIEQQGALLDVLQKKGHLHGGRLVIERDESELFISDKSPGQHISITVELMNGETYVEVTNYGVWALLNDLHKGRNSGAFWRLILDLSAALIIIFSLSGLILALAQRRINRTLITSILTSFSILASYWIFV